MKPRADGGRNETQTPRLTRPRDGKQRNDVKTTPSPNTSQQQVVVVVTGRAEDDAQRRIKKKRYGRERKKRQVKERIIL